MPKSCKILFSEQAPTQYFTAFCPMAELLLLFQENREENEIISFTIIHRILLDFTSFTLNIV